jgi:hypothetical protein
MDLQQNETFKKVRYLYKDDTGKPFELTPFQIEIFDAIYQKLCPRIHLMAYTRYGKSEILSLAILTRITNFNEKWAIIAPTTEKAKIINSYIIKHIFDNSYCQSKFEIKPDENLERIKRERSKERLTFRNSDGIGEVFILSAEESRRGEDAGNKLMGFGAPNIIEDEASLIKDSIQAKITRMLGDSKENFLVKAGNPLKRNKPYSHFYRSFLNPKYRHFVADYLIGIAEGRQLAEFFEEEREEHGDLNFSMMYECKFPDTDTYDDSGYLPLITEDELKRSFSDEFFHFGEERLGCDVAAGGNYSVIVRRSISGAEVVYRAKTRDTMEFASKIAEKQKELRIPDEKVFIDIVGIGRGAYDHLSSKKSRIQGINVGETAFLKNEFTNKRAESYWNMSKWLRTGGKLKNHPSWSELLNIKYTRQADRLIRIKSKKEMISEGVESPDVADALALTFVYPQDFRYRGERSDKEKIQGIGIGVPNQIKGIGRQ